MKSAQEVMDAHIRVATSFPSVKLNTTYSFGLDDQDFVWRSKRRSEDFLGSGDGSCGRPRQQVHGAGHADLHLRADAGWRRCWSSCLAR